MRSLTTFIKNFFQKIYSSEVKKTITIRNFEHNQWNKIFCRMDGLAVTISNSTTIENIDKLVQLMGNWKTFHSCFLNNQVWKLVIPKSNKNISNLLTENQTCFLQLLQAHKNGSECQVFLILKKIIASRILKEKKIYSTHKYIACKLKILQTRAIKWRHMFWIPNS